MKNHLTNIEIKNFKCFKDFKVKGLARVNLITGQNNVGKTAFLEATHIHTIAEDLPLFFTALHSVKYRRENINILFKPEVQNNIAYLEQTNGFNVSSNIHQTSFSIDNSKGIKTYIFKFNGQEICVNSNDFSQEIKVQFNNIFIDNFGFSDGEIIDYFSAIQKLDKENYLNEALHNFDNNITAFKTPNNQPQCKINGKYLRLTELGDGTKHLVSIVVALFACQDSYLFIDEIDNGVHHSKLDDFWEIILTLSNEKNIQVFATTHSKECLESYARVVKKLADKDIALIELGTSDGKLKNIVFNHTEIIEDILFQDEDMRGWE